MTGFVAHMTLGLEEVELASEMDEVARTEPMMTASTM